MNSKQWRRHTAKVLGISLAEAGALTGRNVNRYRNADARIMVGKTVYENRRVYQPRAHTMAAVVYHWEWVPVDAPRGFYPY